MGLSLWDAPLLRGLDERARRELEAAGRLVGAEVGEVVYRAGDPSDSLWVVLSGAVAVEAPPRGEVEPWLLRRVAAGASFGEEATLGAARRATARVVERAKLAEIPAPLFRRVTERAGPGEAAAKLARAVERALMRDGLLASALARALPAGDREAELDALLDVAALRVAARSEPVYREGDPADALYVVVDGLVQLETEDAGRIHVRAFLGRGDCFGDEELLERAPRFASAVSAGRTTLVAIPARDARALAERHGRLEAELRRVALGERARQRALAGGAPTATQHAFRDVYRLEIARSTLLIDQDACVRCGACTSACADLHDGTPRLARRGDKILARVGDGPERRLLVANSCQHCESPACMLECPTAAIGKELTGDVFIREDLCTGCGACVRACPWDNVELAPRTAGGSEGLRRPGSGSTAGGSEGLRRPGSGSTAGGSEGLRRPGSGGTAGAGGSALVAVKCDLCEGAGGPACVRACPTGAVSRVEPTTDVAEIRALVAGRGALRREDASGTPAPARPGAGPWLAAAALWAGAAAVAGGALHARRAVVSGGGAGLALGVAALLTLLALGAHGLARRAPRLWARALPGQAVVARSYALHLVLGGVLPGLILLHAPLPRGGAPTTLGGAAWWCSAVAVLAGALAAAAYAWLPARLSRLERLALLPEDLERRAGDLRGALYREVTGANELVKKVFEKLVVPYARDRLGPLRLLASGRSLAEEEARLAGRVEAVLEGRGGERLAGLRPILKVAVEQRALPAARAAGAFLRALPLVHAASASLALGFGIGHAILALFR